MGFEPQKQEEQEMTPPHRLSPAAKRVITVAVAGNPNAGKSTLINAVAGSPHDPTILSHLGDVYDRLGESELAITTWQKALAEWKRVVPADYEEDKVRNLERKLTDAQRDSARGKKKTVAVKHD